ncbi:MAG: carboxypeptidase regulatory-like domain-containing protein [Bacteroidales bacterium]|nr:carboxypeptidase regulatory-like domain-containing protein [Bacteroidales bacterium]
MKKTILLFLLTIFSLSSFSQEYIFKFKVNTKEEFQKMNRLVSIDHGYGVGEVVAYANAKQFEYFKTLGYKYEMMPHPGKGKSLTMATTVAEMADWDKYPTHDVYLEMMQQLATDYPDICRIETIGTSENGRSVKVLKITDNPDVNENEPEFFYTGQMHGDEIVDYILFLRLSYYLLENYEIDQRITDLINNVEIWINPLANPDGTYHSGDNTVSGATRSNANYVDLNRSFPSPNLPNPSGVNEAEVQMMITFAENHSLDMSANSHSGAELVNFPWDSWTSSHPHADNDWWYQVSRNYADVVHENAPSSYMNAYDNGVTHGGDWYVVDGSRQDHMGYYQYCREVTLELSNNKMLDCELLPAHFTYNRDAMIGYIEEVFYGIRGIVTDENENPLEAVISISGHDQDNSEVITDPATGNYHRMIDNGTYNLTFTVDGYSPVTVNNILVTDEEITIIDVMFDGSPGTTTLSGTIINQETSQAIENAEIIITGQDDTYTIYTNETGQYSVENVTVGTFKFEMSATGYMSAVHYETVSTSYSDVSKSLVPSLEITGTVTENISGNLLSDVKIEFLETSLPDVFTDINGEYSVSGVFEGTYQIKASKTSYTPVTQTVDISSSNTVVDFVLSISNAISFESEVPSFFTFSGDDDWFRSNNQAYDGDYSMESGNITHYETSVMETELNILTAGDISFYKKVSCENGSGSKWDYLSFSIDGDEKNWWDGEVDWSQESYSVSTGTHTFTWMYYRDGSAGGGDNATWVDYIEFPEYFVSGTYTVTFNVTDGTSPVQNATVTFNSQNINTNTSGQAVFNNVESGNNLPWNVSKTGYNTETGTLNVTDANVTHDVTLSETTYIITFIISDRINPVQDANVNFNSDDILTDINGYAIFENIAPGNNLPYIITKTGYNTFNSQVNVINQDVDINITLSESVSIDVILSLSNIKITPNPFTNNAQIEFSIDSKSNVFAAVYSYTGELVNVLLNNELEKGNHKLIWDGTNNSGGRLANGIYFCKIISNNNTQSGKVILLK